MVTEIKSVDADTLRRLRKSDRAMIVEFYADWCGPCKATQAELEALSERLGDAIDIVKIDADAHLEVAAELNVQGIPTVIYFDASGKEVGRQTGAARRGDLAVRLGVSAS